MAHTSKRFTYQSGNLENTANRKAIQESNLEWSLSLRSFNYNNPTNIHIKLQQENEVPICILDESSNLQVFKEFISHDNRNMKSFCNQQEAFEVADTSEH